MTVPETDPLRPTADEVAALVRFRIVGDGGGDPGTFTTDTRPTLVEAEALIDQALVAITGQLPLELATAYMPKTRHTVALYAAILIETSYYRGQLDEGMVEVYRDLLRTNVAQLRDAVAGDAGITRGTVDSVPLRGGSSIDTYTGLPDPILYP